MSINTLSVAFRKLVVDRISTVAAAATTAKYYSTQSSCDFSRFICHGHGLPISATPAYDIKFKPGTLNIDFGIPPTRQSISSIIEIPVARIPPLQEPPKNSPVQHDSPVSQISVDLPTTGTNFEKQAVRLIVIRRKKMKKHKRKKLRKRMKFVWAKLRQRRNKEKIKRFTNEMIAKIKEAEMFDAKDFVKERLHILNKEYPPRTYQGEILPPEMIRRFLEKDKAKKEARRKVPRLTP